MKLSQCVEGSICPQDLSAANNGGNSAHQLGAHEDLGWEGATHECPDEARCGRGVGRRTCFERMRLELIERGARRRGLGSIGSVSQNVDLASKLPESIKQAGVIKIGTDASYAPSEFLAADGKTVEGFEVDLFDAIAAKFGVKTEWQPAKFPSIIGGINGKKYDVGVSSFTINPERMKEVDMVSTFNAGT
jgi:ABC-type amino acid transport substrate-binding protein